MRGFVDIDGELAPAGEAKVSVFDRGLLYGDSAFEAMRTYGQRAFRQDDHLDRLFASCEQLRIGVPTGRAELERRIARAIGAMGGQECYLRLAVTRGSGPMGLDLARAEQPRVLIYALELKLPDPRIYERGIVLGTAHDGRSVRAPGAKHSNYLASVLAFADVRARGGDDALLLGASGEVLEGATSNVFLVRGGRVVTPAVGAGLLSGITRKVVLELCEELGIHARESLLFPPELYGADEVFITSSIREVVPVVRVDDRGVGDGRPGPVAQRLLAAYRAATA